MFVDDLANAFLNHVGMKPAIDKLAHKQKTALDKINQNVYIRDLVVKTPPPYCYGEARAHTNPYTQSNGERIRAHIASLFALGNEDHRVNYCEKDSAGNFNIKKDRENHITRLTTNEFSLYTKEPLSISEFHSLFNDIETMAKQLEANVHVLLCSFAVRSKNGDLLNMSMFVEGGNPPQIHTFSKNTASLIDINYQGNEALFSQQLQGQQVSFHAENISAKDGTTVSTGSVFEVKTKGGACYTQTIDVCLDHATKHSKSLMERRILTEASADEILPIQIEQCVTSNSIFIDDKSTITTKVLHNDPRVSMFDYEDTKPGEKLLSKDAISRIVPNGYNRMDIVKFDKGYRIVNPAFGSDCSVEVLAERPAGKYKPGIMKAVEQHNHGTCERRLFLARKNNLNEQGKLIQKIEQSNLIAEHINQLEKTMLNKCKTNLWERIFKTEEYKQKIKAKAIITNSFKLIKETVSEHGSASMFIIRGWKKDLNFRLNFAGSISTRSPLNSALSKDIKNGIDRLQNHLNIEFEESNQTKPSSAL